MPMHAYMMHGFDLQTYAEASGHPKWEAAMDEEFNSLIENLLTGKFVRPTVRGSPW